MPWASEVSAARCTFASIVRYTLLPTVPGSTFTGGPT